MSHDLIDEFILLWARGLADQDARTPEEAARAAGCRRPDEIAEWISKYRSDDSAA